MQDNTAPFTTSGFWDQVLYNERKNGGDVRVALRCYDRAVALQPGYLRAWLNRGTALAESRGPLRDPRSAEAVLGRLDVCTGRYCQQQL